MTTCLKLQQHIETFYHRVMRSSTIAFSDVVGNSFRFDPSYHLSEANHIRSVLKPLPYGITNVASSADKVFIGNIFSRVFVNDPEYGIPYLAASDTVLANLDTRYYLSRKQASDLAYLMLQKDWILITCSGTLGNVTYTNNNFEGRIATHDLIRIIPNDKEVLRGCLFAYLSSKYGYYQLTQSQFGGVVKHINADQAKNVAVPRFPLSFQQTIDALIKEAARLREESMLALNEAHSLIEAHFPNTLDSHFYEQVSSSTIFCSQIHRFEASYYLSSGKQYDDYIKKHFYWKSLGEVSQTISRPGIAPRMYVKDGVSFLGGTEIFFSIPESKKKLSRAIPNFNDYLIQEGWVLLPRSGTISLGDVVFTNEQHAQKLVSEDVIRIIPNNILRRGFVFSFLSSKIGRSMIQRPIFGSVIQHIEPPLLAVIPIPIFEEEEMNKIAELAEHHRECWGKAAKKELEAISLVEQEIEKWHS